MKILNMPAEILLMILDHVCPDDLVNLVLSCRRVYKYASKHLSAHKEYIYRYSNVVINEFVQPWKPKIYPIKHACVLLYDIQQDHNVKYYVRIIDCNPKHLSMLYNREDDDENVKKLQSLDLDFMLSSWVKDADKLKQLKEAILREWPPEPGVNGWNGVEEGGAAFVLLLSMLPNLKRIDLRSSLFKFSGYLHELLAATKLWIDDKPLQKVEYIGVEHWDTEGSAELVAIGDLIYLPNLKELTILSREHGNWNDDVEPVLTEYSTHRSSTISKVILVNSVITPTNLFHFIRPMNNLRFLEYEYYGILQNRGILLEDLGVEKYRKSFVRLAHDWLEEHDLVTEAMFVEDEVSREKCFFHIHKKGRHRDE